MLTHQVNFRQLKMVLFLSISFFLISDSQNSIIFLDVMLQTLLFFPYLFLEALFISIMPYPKSKVLFTVSEN